MSSRRTKKLKKFILPLTFLLGIAAFPIGKYAFNQTGKAAASLGLIEKTSHKRSVAAHRYKGHGQLKYKKKTSKIAKNKHKSQRKMVRSRSQNRNRYAH